MRKIASCGSVIVMCCLSSALALAQDAPPAERRARPGGEGPPPAATPRERPPEIAGPPRDRPEPLLLPIRLEVTVHQVALTAEGLLQVDAERLAGVARTPAELNEALAKLGATSVLYRIDQPLSLTPGARGESISVSADLPYVSNAGTGKDGQRVMSVNRQRTGVNLRVTAPPPPGPGTPLPGVVLELEMSAVSQSDVKVGGDVPAPVFRSVEVSDAFVPLGRPSISLSIDAAPGPGGQALAYVTRIVVTPLEGPLSGRPPRFGPGQGNDEPRPGGRPEREGRPERQGRGGGGGPERLR